jgi:tetratricopeptide (TPR) repeat protein
MLYALRATNHRMQRTLALVNTLSGWSAYLIPAGLSVAWLLVVLGVPARLPLQPASWLTFLALLITPGYFLADLITWRMDLDWLERLALALPLGVACMALPGIGALLLHVTIRELTAGWMVVSALTMAAWLLHVVWERLLHRLFLNRAQGAPRAAWALDEIVLLLLLAGAFAAIVPTLSLYKIDGDAYAVNSFAADALAGLPLNAREPLFGTSLGPGVRMVFNQSLPMSYLWSYLASIDPITLTASASRSMLGLWALLACYTLGKAAGAGSRRLGLLTAAIQLLIYVAAPFVRGDNVSLFFFERINADKFMVPVTMLPVVFAFSILYVRDGRRETWLAAAIATLAVSTIHPLVAAMLALALAAFGGLRLLLDVQSRLAWKEDPPHPQQDPRGTSNLGGLKPRTLGNVAWDSPRLLFRLKSRTAWKRSLALWALVALAMLLPCVQLLMARGEAPLAPSYPRSLEGWSMGTKLVPVLPFVYVSSLDPYGPLPDLSQLEAGQANTTANPFLIWRFAVNMNRRRLVLFDLQQYISDPSLILEPPYLLALVLLPLLLRRLRSNVGAQFALSTSLAILFVMFNPILTPLIGSLVMPWILWRLVWLLPYALIIALAAERLLAWCAGMVARGLKALRLDIPAGREGLLGGTTALGFILLAAAALSPGIIHNLRNLSDRTAASYFFPTPTGILDRLNQVTSQSGPATVLADQDLSVVIPAYVAQAAIVAHRAPTTSEIFPADQQDVALQRLIDQDVFYRTPYLSATSLDILRRYDVRYVITASGSDNDMQLRLAPQWFEWLLDDQSYSLYAVRQVPTLTTSIQGNGALLGRQWATAEQLYRAALAQDAHDWLALVGLAQVAHSQGRLDEALARLQEIAAQVDLPILHYRMGQLYAERGLIRQSIVEFDQAQRAAPHVTRFHVALGDACLSNGEESCAAAQYAAAVANEAQSDQATALIAQGDLWRRRGRVDRALPLYEQAVALQPSEFNQFVLANAYREAGQFERAQGLVQALRTENPFSAEVVSAAAAMLAAQNRVDEAVNLYRYAIALQDIVAEDSIQTRLYLAQLLLETNRLDKARREIEGVLTLSPFSAPAHQLLGDLYHQQQQFEPAIRAYQRAFELDPTQVAVYVSLSDQLRQHGGEPAGILGLLQTSVRINPSEATLLIAMGDQLQRLGDLPAAADAYQSALDTLDPYTLMPQLRPESIGANRAFAYARLAEVYEDMGQMEPAMSYYQAAVAAAPYLPWTYVLLGDALRRRNDVSAAEAAYRRAVEQYPTHVEAYVRWADLLSARGQADAAGGLYQKALALALARLGQPQPATALLGKVPEVPSLAGLGSDESTSSPPYLSAERVASGSSDVSDPVRQADEIVNVVRALAGLYQVNHQADQAIHLYQQKLEQGRAESWSPTILAQLYKGLGDVYLGRQQLSLATDAYQQAVALDNWWPEARLGLAEALSAQGRSAAALDHLRTAVKIAPGSAEAQVALANALAQQGQQDQALEIYQAVAQAHPGNARATLALARAWHNRHNWDRAEASYRQTLEMNAGAVDATIGLAELAIDRGQYDQAETLLQQALETDRQNINPYLHLFELAQLRGSPATALSWYRRAIAAAPAFDIALYDMLLRYGDYSEALDYVGEALKLQPDDAELLFCLGSVQRRLGHDVEAEAALTSAIRLNPADSRLYAELAEVYLARGQPARALPFYQQAIELQPGVDAYYLAASQIWAGQGQFDQALAILSQGQTQVARPAGLYAARATLDLRQGRPDLALDALQQGLRELGEEPQLLLALATYYASHSDFDQAEQEAKRALELQPYAAAPHIALADLYLTHKQPEPALEQYRQAIALEPRNPGAYLALGAAYRQAGRVEEATKAYTQTLALAPTWAAAYTGLAAIYQDQARWDDAEAVYQRGLDAAPTSGALWVSYAAYWLERGDQERALAALERAAQASPTAETLIARAALYRKVKRPDDAVRDLRLTLEKEPGSVDALLALGDLYKAQNKMADARREYEAVVSLLPDVSVGYLRLGDLASAQGDWKEAERYRTTARQAQPGTPVESDGETR